MEEDIQIGHYSFSLRQVNKSVLIFVEPVYKRETTNEDLDKLKLLLNDLGKWETFVELWKSFLEDLGIKKPENHVKREFGMERYTLEWHKEKDFIGIKITLTPEESLRRSKGRTRCEMLPVDEIRMQLMNLPKWGFLKKFISGLRESL